MIKCGHCKTYHNTVYAVRFCSQVEQAEKRTIQIQIDAINAAFELAEEEEYAERQAAYSFGKYF